MDKIYTEFKLLRYYYCETDLFETLEIEHALEEDIDLKYEYKAISESLNQLNDISYSPSQSSIQNILDYSKTVC
jgi:hypothetical protein